MDCDCLLSYRLSAVPQRTRWLWQQSGWKSCKYMDRLHRALSTTSTVGSSAAYKQQFQKTISRNNHWWRLRVYFTSNQHQFVSWLRCLLFASFLSHNCFLLAPQSKFDGLSCVLYRLKYPCPFFRTQTLMKVNSVDDFSCRTQLLRSWIWVPSLVLFRVFSLRGWSWKVARLFFPLSVGGDVRRFFALRLKTHLNPRFWSSYESENSIFAHWTLLLLLVWERKVKKVHDVFIFFLVLSRLVCQFSKTQLFSGWLNSGSAVACFSRDDVTQNQWRFQTRWHHTNHSQGNECPPEGQTRRLKWWTIMRLVDAIDDTCACACLWH